MKLLAGLGNPGLEYQKNRHNIGFMAVDKIRENFSLEDFKLERKFNAEMCRGEIGREKIMLVKPQTFMNNSGETLQAIIKFYKLNLKDIIVLHDEIDLPLGKIKLSLGKSAAGHNGVKSIIQHLGSEDFVRIRLGISPTKKLPQDRVVKYVLQNFSLFQKKELKNVLEKIPGAIRDFIKEGIDKAMNLYN